MAGPGLPTGRGSEERDIIRRTSDGGAHWVTQRDAVSSPPFGIGYVAFLDTATGIAVGNGGKILRTSDGGITWTDERSGLRDNEPQQFHTGAFPSPTRAFIASTLGYILRWSPLPSGISTPSTAPHHHTASLVTNFLHRDEEIRVIAHPSRPGWLRLSANDTRGEPVAEGEAEWVEDGQRLTLRIDGLGAGHYFVVVREQRGVTGVLPLVVW